MASKLLQSSSVPAVPSFTYGVERFGKQRMRRDSLVRFSAIVLAVLTAACVVFAVINWQKESQYTTPTDGVWWKEHSGFLVARGVIPNGPGDKAGIKVGDKLLRVNGLPKDQTIKNLGEFEKHLYHSGVYSRATYSLDRQGVTVEVGNVIPIPADNSLKLGQRLIALIYLGIGLYVLFRRWTAPKSTHFYIFCLVSFVLYSFHSTGKHNAFDWTIFWSNVVAELLQATLFLHFALTFPEKRSEERRLGPTAHQWMVSLVYLPGLLLLVWRLVAFEEFKGTESLHWNIERLQMAYATIYFLLAAIVLWRSYRKAGTALQQQQLKWISRGTVLAIGPYTLFYVLPYLAGTVPTFAMKISALSLVFLPVTWGYAIVRYRLMDVDIIFKRGVSYTLATAAIVIGYFVGIGGLAGSITTKYPGAGTFGLIAVIKIG